MSKKQQQNGAEQSPRLSDAIVKVINRTVQEGVNGGIVDTTEDAADSKLNMPLDDEGPVFAEPWQAQVFAMTLQLHEQGLFEWNEWAAMLARKIREAQQAGDPDLGNTYYNHWLAALEQILVEKELATRPQLESLRDRWDQAARATPHGQPIELSPDQSNSES